MKFLVFSDIHYNPGGSPSGDEEHIRIMQKRAEENGCDFIISGGDFCFDPSHEISKNFLDLYNSFHIPSYHILGNHDTDYTALSDILKLYKMPHNYYYFDINGYRVIICDSNYYLFDGNYYHYDLKNYHSHINDSILGIIPEEQLEWLKKTIEESEYPCIILSHESFEREMDGVYNRDAIRKIIDEANKRKKHSVLMCINGHYHVDNLRIINDVAYLDLNSASFQMARVEHDLFPDELCQKYSVLRNLVFFNEPLCAVITLEGSHISIEGTEGSYFMGVSPEKAGGPANDRMGRKKTARVLSAKIDL